MMSPASRAEFVWHHWQHQKGMMVRFFVANQSKTRNRHASQHNLLKFQGAAPLLCAYDTWGVLPPTHTQENMRISFFSTDGVPVDNLTKPVRIRYCMYVQT